MASWLRLASCVALIVSCVGPLGAQEQAADAPSALDQECDRLAASAEDPERLSAGVSTGAMDSLAAADACRAALVVKPGSARLQFDYGRVMFKRGDPAQAAQYYKKAADQSYATAKMALGTMAISGVGTDKNPQEALRLFGEAADAGSEGGRARLGLVLLNATSAARDDVRGMALLQQAALAGSPVALASLGNFYIRGDHGLTRDPAKGMRLLRQASDLGDPNASGLLSKLRRTDFGSSRDEVEANMLRIRAAEQGDVESINALVEDYAEGKDGYPKDQNKAIDWQVKGIIAGQTSALADESRPIPADFLAVLQLRLKARGVYDGPTDGSADARFLPAVKLLAGQ